MHKGRKTGEVVESLVFTKGLQQSLGIDLGRCGWFIGTKVHADDVWQGVKDGTFGGFSIGGHGHRTAIEDG
jgi:hypothetical protein